MSSPGARYVTRKQYESHTGKSMHSGGLTPEQMGYAPARRTTTKSSGLGFLGKKPAGFVSRETTGQSHRGVTLFMIGIGLIIVLTAKNSAGQTYVQAAIGWVKGKTTGPGAVASGPPPSSGSQQAPTDSPLGPTSDEIKACGPDPGTSDLVGHFKWLGCVTKYSLTHMTPTGT